MKNLYLVLIFIFCSFIPSLFAQSSEGTIAGKVIDQQGQPLASTSIAVYDSTQSTILTGASSDADGEFSITIKPGSYTIKISYISYKPITKKVVVNTSQTTELDDITMMPTAESLGNIFVRADKSQMQLNFDKRVFNVGKDITSLGGSAVEVLNNVPSIATDIDGNISLRGNESVRVLINGKPSSMVSGDVDALRSIPSTMIKEVEIITNPSSKYAAEGSAGIINIILKKEQGPGINGSLNAGVGLPEQYEGSTNLNYRVKNINWFIDIGADYRSEPESGSSFQRYAGPDAGNPDTTYMYREKTEATESEIDGDLRFGADIHLSDSEVLTASTYLNLEKETNNEDIRYTDYNYRFGAQDGTIQQQIIRDNVEEQQGRNIDFKLNYENKIDGNDHTLVADAGLDISREEAESDIEETVQQGNAIPLKQRAEDTEEEMDLRFNAEYKRPLGKDGKLEAGVRTDTEWMDNSYSAATLVNNSWQEEPAYTQNFLYTENVNAAFLILGGEFGSLSGQVGIRAENTNIRTEIKGTGNVNTQNYIDIFPSIFLNYSFNEQQSIQLSYSRRLSRPWSRSLIPFIDFDDPRSQYTGNPNLKPEFSNSYEAGYLHYWESGSLLTSFYYRHRTDVIERITEQRNGVLFRFPINFATEKSWGVEFSADQEIGSSLNLTANANLFRSNTEGTYENQIFNSESENVRGRMRLRWEITDGLNYQASIRYRGPSDTPQGSREGMTMMDTGISYDLMEDRAKISLNVRDVFDSQNYNNTVTTNGNPDTDFYSHREFSWSSRSFSLNFQYFFGEQQKKDKGRR
ncbi:outer membrane beta-barrel family protein [Fodinibius saliphilus]|uniref:outer membrane beta-barrel family protein n=1 Tax=Fodinibius saliphilus TaxID=1920650 RepID=UPI0011080A08|nr:outer membrane beta-barrel family protein [Fodinibius saliphilus]